MIKSLAELKRTLTKGRVLALVKAPGMHPKHLGTSRKIEKVQTNAIMFEGGSWLAYEKKEYYRFTEKGFIVDTTPDNQSPFTSDNQSPFTSYLEYEIVEE